MVRKIWVIGGGRGIGREIVRDLVHQGYEVSATYRSSSAEIEKLADELKASGYHLHFEALDLNDEAMLAQFSTSLESQTDLYGLVYCAAAKYDSLLAMTKDQKVSDTFQTNILSAISLTRGATKPMCRARNGRVVLVSSIAAQRTGRGNSIYAATKGALDSFCKSVANELSRRSVTINCVSPGFIDTDMLDGYGSALTETTKSLPSRRLGTPNEVSTAVSYLLSEGASYVNGTTLVVDGAASGSFQM